jgi:hypothetical protein
MGDAVKDYIAPAEGHASELEQGQVLVTFTAGMLVV